MDPPRTILYGGAIQNEPLQSISQSGTFRTTVGAMLYISLILGTPPAQKVEDFRNVSSKVFFGGRSLGECRGIHFHAEGVGATP